jgi:pimeloyl-ACP methyl ester carboxylesterase
MATVTSKDGTKIAFDRSGQGPPLVLVTGAMCTRFGASSLPRLLAPHFTVYDYDRRGRGESGDTKPYAVEREVEDIEALIDEAGEAAHVYGHSSGGALALEAAMRLGDKIASLAVYEVPYNDDPAAQEGWRAYGERLGEVVAAGGTGEAVELFMKLVGMPDARLAQMKAGPVWPRLAAIGPSLPYDHAVMGENAVVPRERAARVRTKTLVMNGSATYPFMAVAAVTLSKAMPHAQHRVLEGQTHEVANEALAPVLIEHSASVIGT